MIKVKFKKKHTKKDETDAEMYKEYEYRRGLEAASNLGLIVKAEFDMNEELR